MINLFLADHVGAVAKTGVNSVTAHIGCWFCLQYTCLIHFSHKCAEEDKLMLWNTAHFKAVQAFVSTIQKKSGCTALADKLLKETGYQESIVSFIAYFMI